MTEKTTDSCRMPLSFLNRSFNRSGRKARASANNNTINEEERNRMNNTVCGAPIKSPRSKFQRNNSNPFPETVSGAASVQETQKKIDDCKQLKSFGKFLKYIRPLSRKEKNLPVHDSSFKAYENNSSDELNVSPMASPQQCVMGQVYETSINKHGVGDAVEYAVPYSELQSPIVNDSVSSGCETEAKENELNESKWSDRLVDINALFVVSPIKTTDLDKSSDGYRSLDQSGKGIADSKNKDALSELAALERWSQSIPQRSLPAQEPPVDTNIHVIKCKPREIKPKRSVLRNTIALPLHFSSGYFRKTPVALRKCCPRDPTSVGLVEEAIERDYEILNKVKHSNIILLMAASFHQKSFDHMTLVLEPVDYTLNYFLHQMDTTLSIVDTISVVQQIAGAALYLQESGYIHSNISSHNILVREDPWCVKLSSFELTTEVDFADTRAELSVEYRHNLSSFNNGCTDTPKYTPAEDETVSLRDQYRQLSKMLPTLKCCPSTQHSYLSMLSKHLIYDTNYRQHLSLHNFQAPELLTTKRQFVFPTTKADVYSLCLLLWEMLNKCVPFVVYSKLDMERRIQSKKLSLPFFERERCQPFMEIFQIGLALNPDNRTIDVQQLIANLEDVKSRIRSGVKDLEKEQPVQRSVVDEVNLCVNTVAEDCQKNEGLSTSSLFSPNSTDFNHRLHESEVTSTKKKKRKSPQKFIKKRTFRQLFKHSNEGVNDGECERFLTDARPGSSQHPLTGSGTERNRTLSNSSNCSTLPMSQKVCTDSRNPSSNIDQPKFWKRESVEDGNVITSKWPSVRDKILKFEECGMLATKTLLPLKTATKFVKNLSKSVTSTQSNGIGSTEAPDLIKDTIYSESVPGVDLASLLTTKVTLNMGRVRHRSSDLDEVDRPKIVGVTEIRHTICGSQKELLSFNTRVSQDGSSGGKTKYICTDCTTKMSSDELRALTLESVDESSLNATTVTDYSLPWPGTTSQRTPLKRCQVRVKSQYIRSIEDLYIDDDFDQGLGLGANIELLSDCSDFLNFDIIHDVFDKSNMDK